MSYYDRIVIGLGGVGSAALLSLARRGVRSLGIEPHGIGHDRGSSHGQTRMIRQAYFENPQYVPLLKRAYELWYQLEQESHQRLFEQVGLLEIGPPDGVLIPGVRRSASLHNLPVEHLSPREVTRRYPAFQVPQGMEALFEPTAGFLHVERCVETQVRQAEQFGAQVICDQPVVEIDWDGDDLLVQTPSDSFHAGGIVCCVGAWSARLLPFILPLRVVRKHLHWFACAEDSMHFRANCPGFFYELPSGLYYGFPAIDSRGAKVGEHSGGETVHEPSRLDLSLDPIDLERVEGFRRECLTATLSTHRHHAVCMYTLTPDEHFIIDRMPQDRRGVFAAGLSGHGFKFVPVIGEILADLSLDNATSWPIEFMSASRFSM